MDEKRKRHRVNFETEVRLKTAEDNIITANSADISMSGLFLETNQTLEIGLECEVSLIIKGKTSKLTIITFGKIVRHVEKSIIGIGVEFVDDLEWWSLFSIYQLYGERVIDLSDKDQLEVFYEDQLGIFAQRPYFLKKG